VSVDISICLPSIRTRNLKRLYKSLLDAVGKYSFELIVASPYDLPSELLTAHVRLVKDFGCPTRCLQLAAKHSKGDLLTTASDDGVFEKNSISKSIEFYEKHCTDKDAVVMRYTETPGLLMHSKVHSDDRYWNSYYHPTLRLKGISTVNKWGPLLMKTDFFKEIGGFDCVFEHYNYCLHDLCYRMQQNGSQLFLSPSFVMHCDWNPNEAEYQPVKAVAATDYSIFKKMYKRPNNRYKIYFDNWKNVPAKWGRF